MDLYKNATFTDEYRVYAKNEVAALRKMKKAIDDKRKEVKNQYMIPYSDFEEKAKELMKIIDQPISLISQQITEMEERRRAEKKTKIEALFDSLVGDLSGYLTLEKIYNARWENASMSMTAVKKELDRCTADVYRDYMRGGYKGQVPTLKDLYRQLMLQPEGLHCPQNCLSMVV